MKCSLGISNFLEEISSLSYSIVFPLFLCIDHWGRLSYLSLLFFGTLIQMGISFLFSYLSFSLLFTAILKASSDSHYAFLHFFFLGIVLITASCTMLWTSAHSSSGTLSDLIPWIYLSCHACLFAYIPFPLPEILEILFISFWKRSLVHF